MRIFEVQKSGLFTTVQDLGRYGFLRYGVPISGAMDTFSFTVANLLVGNGSNDACLETTLVGPQLLALAGTQIAITGGTTSPKINGQDAPMWQTLAIRRGDIISLGKIENGCRAYLSVRGGIDVPYVLGSRSTYVRGGFGGLDGRQLKTADIIQGFWVKPLEGRNILPERLIPELGDKYSVHVVLGPQADMFTEKGKEAFLSSSYGITSEADRMGYRLEGPTIEHKMKADIISDALLPGAIQVPKSGQPIIIMRDAQTTGGYAKIGVVISPDISLVAQAKPTDTIEFHKTTLEQAQEKCREFHRKLSDLGQESKKE